MTNDSQAATSADDAVHDTAAQLHEDLRKRLTATGLTWDGVEQATKTPKSTIRDRLRVKATWRRPIKLVSLDDLTTWLTRTGAEKSEIDGWVRRRDKLLGSQFGAVTLPGAAADASDDRRPVRRYRMIIGAFIVLVAGVLVGVVVGRVTAPPSTTGSGISETTAAPGGHAAGTPCGRLPVDLREDAVSVKVGDTGGRGVTMYGGPANTFCEAGALSEGRDIRVVCLELHGQPVTDEFGGKVITSSVWARLSSGGYVPQVYTTLPPADGGLVAGLDRC